MTTEKTVLLVDDDPNILQVAGFAVAKAGYRVVTAKDGKQALELVRSEAPCLIGEQRAGVDLLTNAL